jgi:HSP20 family protein
MASFFEKLIGGQIEKQEEKKVIARSGIPGVTPAIRKPVKKMVKLEEKFEEEKEIKKPAHKPEPEPEIENEKEIEEDKEIIQKIERQDVQIQAKTETKIKEPEKKKTSQEDWPSSEEGQLAIDVYQNEGEIVVQSTIGGVKPNDLEIIIENGMVHIKGHRQKTEIVGKDDYFIQECHWGAFSRQLVLPSEVDSSRAEAILKDGVLTIKIPRIQREKVTKLKIKE